MNHSEVTIQNSQFRIHKGSDAVRNWLVLCALVAGAAGLAAQSDSPESGPVAVPCRSAAASLRDARFHLNVGVVTLRDGRGQLGDRSNGGGPEWEIRLTRAQQWGPDGRFLIASVNAEHRAGSGAWDSVFVYACEQGVLRQVFTARYLYGARVELGASEFRISSGLWSPADAMCCPSQQRQDHWIWNGPQRAFERRSVRVSAGVN